MTNNIVYFGTTGSVTVNSIENKILQRKKNKQKNKINTYI